MGAPEILIFVVPIVIGMVGVGITLAIRAAWRWLMKPRAWVD